MVAMIPPITTVDSENGCEQLKRVLFRSPRPGPEAELVHQFLTQARLRACGDCRITIFIEPKLEGCYPDVVLVAWRPSVTRQWPAERRNLEAHDLRVLQHLVNCGNQRDVDLIGLFGTAVRKRLDRLHNAELVSKARTLWRAKPLPSIFATVAIVAVEAKMRDWNAAIKQAFLNTWFASESYVLVPGTRAATRLLPSASAHGIGVLNTDSRLCFRRARMRPRSYASWQLNEWAWRAAIHSSGN